MIAGASNVAVIRTPTVTDRVEAIGEHRRHLRFERPAETNYPCKEPVLILAADERDGAAVVRRKNSAQALRQKTVVRELFPDPMAAATLRSFVSSSARSMAGRDRGYA